MIEEDIKFFRENFSASSFSNSDEEPHATYPEENFQVPFASYSQDKKKVRAFDHKRGSISETF